MLDFRLIAISDSARYTGATEGERAEHTIRQFQILRDAGLKAYQLREKLWCDATRLRVARTLVESKEVSILINDRPDIAILSKASGIHLPEQGWTIAEARTLFANGIIGKSCHSIASGLTAAGADYLVFGPVFETESKKQFGAPLGLELLREFCAVVTAPVFAVGGISPARTEVCRAAGAHGVAVIGALHSSHPMQTLREFQQALGEL